jgi:long-chain acyl-CoA synthetase
MRAVAAHSPNKIALKENGRSLTFAQLVERADKIAAVLAGLGVVRGDRIALLSPNRLEYIEIVLGASCAGIPVATLNPRLLQREVVDICNDCGARVLFVDASLDELARTASFETVEQIITIDDEYEMMLGRARAVAPIRIEEWDPFAIPYTSGTTGRPKGVVLPHRSRVMTFFAMAAEYGCYSPDDYYLAIAPLFHGAGLAFAMAAIYFGGTCEVLSRFDPAEVIGKLGQGFTGTFMVPTHFHAIFALEPTLLANARTHRLKAIVSNAAPLPYSTKEKIIDQWGAGLLHETYGSTEGGIVTNLRPEFQLLKQMCVGKPFPCTSVRLVDDSGQDVKPGEVGELYSRSPYLFNGYHGRPEETEASLSNGWFSAGDMARRDDEGFIYLVDRKKDMVISGGVNIYPREIEEVLFRHPSIATAAVIGLPNHHWGEAVTAVVVVRAGAVLTADEVSDFCRRELAPFKLPRNIVFVDKLPVNAAGKVLKTELRKMELP